MRCDEAMLLMDASIDGELDLRSALEIERHADACHACAPSFAARRALVAGLRAARPVFVPPDGFEERIRAVVRREADVAPPAVVPRSRDWRAVVAIAAALVVVTGTIALWVFRDARSGDEVARDAVASHVRSLMAAHLTDVPSSDRHTVKPWFEGKLDFAPPVVDLSDAGFPLVGGRLDYVGDEPAAALVYTRRQHTINLFVRPAPTASEGPARSRSIRGYTVVEWTSGGTAYTAVSDLSADELAQFAELVQARAQTDPQR